MGFKRRKHRLHFFQKRAEAFVSDIEKGRGNKVVLRERGHNQGDLVVGVKQHKRLVFKEGAKRAFHTIRAADDYRRLSHYYKQRGYLPSSYKLVSPMFSVVSGGTGVVQEYYNKPSLSELLGYARMLENIQKKENGLGRKLNASERKIFYGRFVAGKEAALRCKQFLNEKFNKSITCEQMEYLYKELFGDAQHVGIMCKPSNYIVLGQIIEEGVQMIRLGLIDY